MNLEGVDWSAPWLAPWRERGQRVATRVQAGTALHDALNAEGGGPVRFVPQTALPTGESYERYIFNSKQCPIREDLHDFFNGICWLQFPRIKQRLNQLQAQAIANQGVGAQRGPLRDAVTVLDENAAFLMAPPDVAAQLWPALLARDWHGLFLDLRPLWRQVRPVLFGHALLEKLVHPRKPVTAHVFLAPLAIMSMAELDACIASQLDADTLIQKPFTPLPVLGVPGWWADNENPDFYNDPSVFRVVP